VRRSDLIGGKATAFDALAFVIWVCLLLVPIFSEFKFLGVEFKQKIEELKNHIDGQVLTLQSEIHNSVDFRPQVNPHFTFSAPPPDTQLPSLEKQIRPIIEETLKVMGVQRHGENLLSAEVPPDVQFLLLTRYSIERELRQLWTASFGTEAERASTPRLLPALVEAGILTTNLAKAIREVYSVCSPAVHGEDISEAKVRFVRELAAGLLSSLRVIRPDAQKTVTTA
jgi:hypothetical protein